jgi:ATP-dependent Clp protease ATP-binding subunit ClpX
LRQERKKMAYKGVDLTFTDDAVSEIAEQAVQKGTGARALRTVVTDFMSDITFALPDNPKGCRVVIDRDVVKKLKSPSYLPIGKAA